MIPPEPRAASEAATQRLRVGAIGLAGVFLLVMLAAAFVRSAGDHPTAADNAIANAAEPSEPLAQLGVAPGNAEPVPAAVPAANTTGGKTPSAAPGHMPAS